jgi:hypothetical protein
MVISKIISQFLSAALVPVGINVLLGTLIRGSSRRPIGRDTRLAVHVSSTVADGGSTLGCESVAATTSIPGRMVRA